MMGQLLNRWPIPLLLSSLWLMACQPQEQQPATDQPAKPHMQAARFISHDGTALPLRHWLPAAGQPVKAVILALHGFNDYSHAFDLPGRTLKQQGVALYAYDQRGFGESQQRGIWGSEALLGADVRAALAVLREKHPGVPLYLLGESMGGAVAMTACAKGDCGTLNGIVLVAPAVWGQDSFSPLYRASLWLMAHSFPSSQWTGENLDILATDNIPLLREMARDPQIIKKTRIDAMYGIVHLMDDAFVSAEKLKHPLLILYGRQDEIIPPEPVGAVISRLKAPHNVALYPQGYHMLLRDRQRETVYRDMLSWMEDRYHPLPSGHDMGWKDLLHAPYDMKPERKKQNFTHRPGMKGRN